MRSIGIGVIGAGAMGTEHARIFGTEISRAELIAVADSDLRRASNAAAGAKAMSRAEALIEDPAVDAICIASPDSTHHGLVLAAIRKGKPVLCEKPLAVTSAECLEIVDAERQAGVRLVQTGFMRRFDPGYRQMKAILDTGELGVARIVHCQHRNASAPEWFTGAMTITNALVHEIDICRWLLSAEFSAATVISTPNNDPILFVLETNGGCLVSVEVFMNAGYGYHVNAEAVCGEGSVTLPQPGTPRVHSVGTEKTRFPENWIPRFRDAYRLQNQAWVDPIFYGGLPPGASSAWDGLVATCLAEQIVQAMASGTRTLLELPHRPS